MEPPRVGASDAGEGADANDPEVAAVLEGRDSIRIEGDLLVEPAPPEKKESFVARVRKMSVAERVKLALAGNKEARTILARDPVKLVQTCVLKNPRFTLEEALAMA